MCERERERKRERERERARERKRERKTEREKEHRQQKKKEKKGGMKVRERIVIIKRGRTNDGYSILYIYICTMVRAIVSFSSSILKEREIERHRERE